MMALVQFKVIDKIAAVKETESIIFQGLNGWDGWSVLLFKEKSGALPATILLAALQDLIISGLTKITYGAEWLKRCLENDSVFR